MWGAWWEIAVADTGYGISEEDQARLFTKFFRSGQQEVEQERGTGLGLALAKQMVERLGGTITVRSQLGVGSTFTIAFPLVRPEAAAPEDTPVPSAAASGVPQSGGA
jgi:signal transduction histidine kinase